MTGAGATRVAFQPGPGGCVARGDANQSIGIWRWPDSGLDFGANPQKQLAGHTGVIVRLRRLADGRLLSQGQDGAVFIWDPLTALRLASYSGVGQALASADGRRVWMLSTGGAVSVVDLPPAGQGLLDQARSRGGGLSSADRARYFLPPTSAPTPPR